MASSFSYGSNGSIIDNNNNEMDVVSSSSYVNSSSSNINTNSNRIRSADEDLEYNAKRQRKLYATEPSSLQGFYEAIAYYERMKQENNLLIRSLVLKNGQLDPEINILLMENDEYDKTINNLEIGKMKMFPSIGNASPDLIMRQIGEISDIVRAGYNPNLPSMINELREFNLSGTDFFIETTLYSPRVIFPLVQEYLQDEVLYNLKQKAYLKYKELQKNMVSELKYRKKEYQIHFDKLQDLYIRGKITGEERDQCIQNKFHGLPATYTNEEQNKIVGFIMKFCYKRDRVVLLKYEFNELKREIIQLKERIGWLARIMADFGPNQYNGKLKRAGVYNTLRRTNPLNALSGISTGTDMDPEHSILLRTIADYANGPLPTYGPVLNLDDPKKESYPVDHYEVELIEDLTEYEVDDEDLESSRSALESLDRPKFSSDEDDSNDDEDGNDQDEDEDGSDQDEDEDEDDDDVDEDSNRTHRPRR